MYFWKFSCNTYLSKQRYDEMTVFSEFLIHSVLPLPLPPPPPLTDNSCFPFNEQKLKVTSLFWPDFLYCYSWIWYKPDAPQSVSKHKDIAFTVNIRMTQKHSPLYDTHFASRCSAKEHRFYKEYTIVYNGSCGILAKVSVSIGLTITASAAITLERTQIQL